VVGRGLAKPGLLREIAQIMPTLRDKLLDPSVRPQAVAATCALVDAEVASKRGISGAAIKTAYGVVGRLKPRIFHDVVDKLLPDFSEALEPFHQRALAEAEADGKPVSEAAQSVFRGDAEAVAEALLGVTDRRIHDARQPIKGTYERLRSTAKTHVRGAVPGLAGALGEFL